MAVVPQAITDFHEFIFVNLSDARSLEMPLLYSAWPGLTLIAFYLYFSLSLGPQIMRNRPPMKLHKLLVAYNIFQIAASTTLFGACVWLFTKGNVNILCAPVNYDDTFSSKLAFYGTYAYFMLKLVDWLDTVFIVLRKKENQISFLHLYHHTMIAAAAWGGAKYFPGGVSVVLGFMNTFVHAIMYTYYLLSALEYKNVTRWKKYVTLLQMVQFVLLILHAVQLRLFQSCSYPIGKYSAVIVPQYGVMLYLFYKFYVRAYGKNSEANTNKPTKPSVNGVSRTSEPNSSQPTHESKKID